MANTYGWLVGGNAHNDTQSVTRAGSKYVYSKLQTHEGKLESEVWHDGRFRVSVNGHEIAVGNVNRDEAMLGAGITHYNAAGGGGGYDRKRLLVDNILEAVEEYKREV